MKRLYTCFIFGEGKKDKNFINLLIDLPKFKYHTKNWRFTCGNSSGGYAEDVLKKCQKETFSLGYDLILCFIDLDVLKKRFPKNWDSKRVEIETKYPKINIIWQVDNAEDEYRKVLGSKIKGKYKLNQEAKRRVNEFINSKLWNKIKTVIQNRELILKSDLN